MVMPKPHCLFTTTTKKKKKKEREKYAPPIVSDRFRANKLNYEHACMILILGQGSALPDLGSLSGPRTYKQRRLHPKACPRWIPDWHCSCRCLLISNQLAPILRIEGRSDVIVEGYMALAVFTHVAVCSEIYSCIMHQVPQAKTKIISEGLDHQG